MKERTIMILLYLALGAATFAGLIGLVALLGRD